LREGVGRSALGAGRPKAKGGKPRAKGERRRAKGEGARSDGQPRIFVFSTPAETARAAAKLIAAELRKTGPRRLILASGRTMVPVYRELVRLHRRGQAPFRGRSTWNLDELAVPSEDPRSFSTFMERHLFSKVDLDPARIHFLSGDGEDLERECRRFERELARQGPANLALVGIGVNGHVAYLEPARALPPRSSPVILSASTRKRLAQDGLRPVPRRALTMGIETILSAREILLVAIGAEKALPLAAALTGPVTPRLPASFLSLHPRLTVVADRAAAARISPHV
jgi:glucosamine-6-phosphate deaminase